MITQTCHPLTARRWFRLRGLCNGAIVLAVFVPLVFVLQNYMYFLTADLIAIGIAFGLFVFVLNKRAIAIICPHCTEYVETNTPWVCGYKGCHNHNVDDFPFISRCEHCEAEPKAYKCHHKDCGKPIFFTKDKQPINHAKCLNARSESEPRSVTKDEHSTRLNEVRKNVERKELEAREAKLDVELKGLRQNLEVPKIKSIEDKYRAALRNEDDERRLRAEIDEEFQDDDGERKRRHLVVDRIMRGTL